MAGTQRVGWIRSRQGLIGHFALLALMLKLVVAYGHHHFDSAAHQHNPAALNPYVITHGHDGAAQGHDDRADHAPGGDHDSNGHLHHKAHERGHGTGSAAQVCFDCVTLGAASLASEPPAAQQHQAVTATSRVISNNPVHLIDHRGAFRARAPPLAFPAT